MSPLDFVQRLTALALLNDRLKALSLAERMRELGRMRVYATPICTSASCQVLPFSSSWWPTDQPPRTSMLRWPK